MEHKFKLYLILIFFLAIAACNREDDVNDPVIEYTEPGELAAFNLPDTIDIKVRVTDDNRLSMVTLNLLNEDKIPCVTPQYFYPSGDELSINTSLALYDKSMPSGTYSLQVFASDGVNTKFKYRDIVIKEIPVEILGYMAITAPLSFKSTLIRLTKDFETDSQLVINDAYWLSCTIGLWDKFFFVSDEPSVISAYNPMSFELEWEVSANQPRALITDMFPDKELLVSSANGNVSIMSESGAIILQTIPYSDKKATFLAADETYIYAAHKSLNGSIHHLTSYYRETGAIMDQPQFSSEIINLVPLTGTLLVFFKADYGFGIMEYDPVYFTLENVDLLPGENLRSVEKISGNSMFLVTDRAVILYNFTENSFDDFTSQPYDFCRFDKVNKVVFLAKDKTVTGFSLATGNLVEEIPFNDKVVDFQILYNK